MFFTFVTKILLTLLFLNTVYMLNYKVKYMNAVKEILKSLLHQKFKRTAVTFAIYTCLLDEFLRNAR